MSIGDRADLLDQQVLHHEIHRRASSVGLSVKFDDKILAAHTDGKVLTIPRPKPPITKTELAKLRGDVIHEVGHVNRMEAFKIAKDHHLKPGRPHHEMFNLVEDESLERGIAHEFLGDAASLGEAYRHHLTSMLGHLIPQLKELEGKLTDEDTSKLAALTMAMQTRDWDRQSEAARDLWEDAMPKAVQDKVKQLRDRGFDKKLKKVRTVPESWNYTQELTKYLFPNEPEPKEEPQGANGQGEGDGNAEGKQQGKSEGKGEPTDSKGKIRWEDLKRSEHDPNSPKVQGGGVDWSGWRGACVDPVFLSRSFQPKGQKKPAPPNSTLAGRLRILVQSRARSKMIYDKPTGRLNKRRLGLLAMPVVPGSTAHKRAFKRRVDASKINTVCHILVDCSGSMSGEKQKIAAQAADRLCTSLANALRVKTAVTGFGGSHNSVTLWRAKEFQNPPVPGEVSGLETANGGGNADGDAVMYAIETLVPRREERKMIIVLSDGMPSACAPSLDAASMLKASIKCAKDRGIEMYGIGIMDNSVKIFYGEKTKVINTLDEFDQALLGTLAERLTAPV